MEVTFATCHSLAIPGIVQAMERGMDRKYVQCLGYVAGKNMGEFFDIIFTSYF